MLKGHLVLLAEDEPLIAFDTEEVLRAMGADVLVAPDFDAMSATGKTEVTAAVLDYRLAKQTIELVCARLKSRRVPYVITTGDDGMPDMGVKLC